MPRGDRAHSVMTITSACRLRGNIFADGKIAACLEEKMGPGVNSFVRKSSTTVVDHKFGRDDRRRVDCVLGASAAEVSRNTQPVRIGCDE
jgi:hypothetical protein